MISEVIIKVRTTDGKLFKVPDVAFVEVCDEENNLAGILHLDPVAHSVKLYTPGDLSFERYCASFKRKPSRGA